MYFVLISLFTNNYVMPIQAAIVALAATSTGGAFLVMGSFFMVGLVPLVGSMIFKK